MQQTIKCPHCGAPPPFPLDHEGEFGYACPYCRQHSVLGTPKAPPPPQAPAIIIVHAPGHDHDDDDFHHHAHQAAVAHANVARSMSWVVWLVMVLVFSLGGGGFAFTRCSKHSALISSLVWDGTEPLQCGGVDQISVTGVEANFSAGSAIVATGNCHFRCTDCKISAPVAIEASGNAQVTMINGTIRGTAILADASGNARVDIAGNATVSGRVRENANAKVSAPPPPPEPTPAPATATAAPVASATAAPAAKAAVNTKPAAAPAAKPAAPAATPAKPKPVAK